LAAPESGRVEVATLLLGLTHRYLAGRNARRERQPHARERAVPWAAVQLFARAAVAFVGWGTRRSVRTRSFRWWSAVLIAAVTLWVVASAAIERRERRTRRSALRGTRAATRRIRFSSGPLGSEAPSDSSGPTTARRGRSPRATGRDLLGR
jgi:uncharacterized membrane protein YfcA